MRECSRILTGLVFCLAVAWSSAIWGQDEKSPASKADHAEAQAKSESTHPPGSEHSASGHAESDHAAGAHHDDSDLSHGNASASLTDPAELRFDLSIYSFIVFLLLLGVLYKFAWGPIALALERRENTIARQIEEAKLASEKGASLLREYEAKLAAATDEARNIVAGARKDAETAKDRIVAEARDAAQRERERAVADITVAKNQALDAIAKKSVETAVSLASNIIRREVKPQEHEALIGQAINEFQSVN